MEHTTSNTITHLELLADLEGVELLLPGSLWELLQSVLVRQEGTIFWQGL